MTGKVALGCEGEVRQLPVSSILPMRLLDDGIRRTSKYRCIEASIRELGLIEPLVVFPQPGRNDAFMLLDGHIRLKILMDLQTPTAKCLISIDDEGFTYNHKISRLSAIQEHFMILRAIKDGVDENRIARSLAVDMHSIKQKRDLLEGICPEAVHLLKEKSVTGNGLRELRKVKPMRQIEIAELMCAAHNFSLGYAKCLVASSAEDHLVDPERGKEVKGLTADDIARMEHETEALGKEFKLIEETHGKNTLNLVLVVGYLRKIMNNSRVIKYLHQTHPEICVEFQRLSETRSLVDAPTKQANASKTESNAAH